MRWLFGSAALVAVLFAAGCGGGAGGSGGGGTTQTSALATKSPRAVLRDASKAVEAASSFHISGQIKGFGGGNFVSSGAPVGIDFTIVRAKGATGSLTVGGGEVDIIVTGGNAYMRASTDFWRQLAKQKGGGQVAGFAATLFSDKWLKFPAGSKQFGQFTNPAKLGTLFENLGSKRPQGRLENKGDTTFKGQSVVAIESSKGGMLYVAATGTPYPVALVKTGGKSNGAVTFDDWNKSVTLTAPKGALDLSQFGG